MVSLCHVLIPQNSSLIVIACIDLMRLIWIDSQMIAKDKTWILLYNDSVVSHRASLEDKQQRVLIYHGFTVLLILFPYVLCVQKPFCANIYISFSFVLQEICPKLNAESLSEEMQKRPPPMDLMTVRRAYDGL